MRSAAASSSAPAPFSRSRGVTVAVLAIALAVAVTGLLHLRADRRLRAELVATAQALGLTDPALERAVRWAADGDRARIVLGRALVFAGLGEGGAAQAEPVDRTVAVGRFERAATLGEEALHSRPTSREAATLVGAARYLAWSTARDDRLITAHEHWEEPLRLARRLGPRDREAARFLAMAYLELWSSLADGKRAEARDVVALAFEDINAYYKLIDDWVAVAGTGEPALAVIPPLPEAWTYLAERVAAQGDAEAYCRVRGRIGAVAGARFDERLVDARRRLAGGEPEQARARLLAALAELPPDGRFGSQVAAALGEFPVGPPEPLRAAGLRAWSRFELEQVALGRAGLDPRKIEALTRAAGLVLPEPTATDATLALAAESALATTDLAAAERFERLAAALTSSTWSSYWLAKARVLADRGDGDSLRRALAALAVAAPGRFELELAVVRRLAADAAGEPTVRAAAHAELARFDVRRWPVEAWTVTPEDTRLTFYSGRPARGFRVDLHPQTARGSAVIVRVDGREVLCQALSASRGVAVTVPLEAGLHRIELASPPGLAGYPTELVLVE